MLVISFGFLDVQYSINKKKSKLFFCKMPCLSAYLRESLDFFEVGIFGKMNNIRSRAVEIIDVELICV